MKPETALNSPKNGTLPPKQEAAALALASGRTIEQAARASNSGTRTLKTWLHEQPAFGRRVTELRGEMTGRALGRLVDGMASAAETLGYLSRKGKSEMVRLSAARAVLELGHKLRESVELEERIAALEGRQVHRRIA
jgi:transposase-like protein